MSEHLDNLINELSKLPLGPWEPCVLRFEHGTEVYWKQGSHVAEWITNEITLYRIPETGEIVGCRIENLREEPLPKFEFTQEILDGLAALPQPPDDDD